MPLNSDFNERELQELTFDVIYAVHCLNIYFLCTSVFSQRQPCHMLTVRAFSKQDAMR